MNSREDRGIILEELDHQNEAIKSILEAMPQLDESADNSADNANPLIKDSGDETKFIDVEMATGTGKTYTYTKMMFELNERFGISKFVVIVPSSAIKVGTETSLKSSDYRRHFAEKYNGVTLNVSTINKGDFTSKGNRRSMPFYIKEFCENNSHASRNIDVILLNFKGFLDKKDEDEIDPGAKATSVSSLFRSDYDTGLFGGLSNPADMIASTRPFVIVDEPHKFRRDGKAYEKMIKHFKPQMVVRFGATFPQISEGKGSKKTYKTDYYRGMPAFTLTTFDAMERGLVKGVADCYPTKNATDDAYIVTEACSKYLKLEKDGKNFEVRQYDKLDDILGDPCLVDIEYVGKEKDEDGYFLSNGLRVAQGVKIYPEILGHEYQKELIKQALDTHFEQEKSNFISSEFKIKTNALFFIDSISSYRKRGNSETWLKDIFEEVLQGKLEKLIEEENNDEYRDFLEASLRNIENCHGGYFSEDNSSSDDRIAAEVDSILRDKTSSLQFKDESGKWNLRRFFFSKWTLREGWDNPNVFTICKLRSSGSEISKIQEVGRGLRLPVNEKGKRLDGLEWELKYIVDESEKDFIEKLKTEVNSTAGRFVSKDEKLDEEIIAKLIEKKYAKKSFDVRSKLLQEGIIDEDEKIIDAKALNKLLGAKETTRVRSFADKPATVKLRQNNWRNLEKIWAEFSKRYMIKFDDVPELESLFLSCLSPSVFDDNTTAELVTQKLVSSGKEMDIATSTKTVDSSDKIAIMPYKTFLKSLSIRTSLPKQMIHSALKARSKDFEITEKNFNRKTLDNIAKAWQEKFEEIFEQKYEFKKLDFTANTSVYANGSFKEEIRSGMIGAHKVKVAELDKRYLYDEILVDSIDPEAEIAGYVPDDKIVVFGKLPRRSIQIPTYTGGTTSPDFIYMKDGNLYLLIEAKPPESAQRVNDQRVVNAQKKFFEEELDGSVECREVTNKNKAVTEINYFVSS